MEEGRWELVEKREGMTLCIEAFFISIPYDHPWHFQKSLMPKSQKHYRIYMIKLDELTIHLNKIIHILS